MATSWSFDSFLSMASKSFEIKKKVAFYERVKVIEIPSARILTRKEKKALWHPEPPEWKKGGSRIRQLMCAIDFDDDSDEGRDDDEEVDELGNKKRYPVSAVLDEQRNQRELGKEVDDEFIAKMYQRCSAHSLRRAQLRAVQDELDEENIFRIHGTDHLVESGH
eukprot:CAMPEP_0178754220 /NCGR_PEP_ID=MMETSP0744-20121128/12043_1 /TAXON_ID=913974 /ORGANISM="Nitzschia punctata, Strain CCMP561" /LENGTH=163 /DNA_ID=CAMNT_0020408117 /DNA_START=61 /DNA_END=553 /DNA_ORIENTATION=-